MKKGLIKHVKNLSNPIIFDRNKEFIYLPINKNAQSSIARNLLANRCIIKKSSPYEWKLRMFLLNKKQFNTTFKFVIIRNPFDRFTSAYNYLYNTSKYFKEKYQNTPIDKFILDYLYDHNQDNFIDPHFETQHDKVFYEDQKIPDHIIKFENLNIGWKLVAEKIHCSGEIPHKNKSSGPLKDFEFFNDTRVLTKFTNLYRKDFEFLGYSDSPNKSKI